MNQKEAESSSPNTNTSEERLGVVGAIDRRRGGELHEKKKALLRGLKCLKPGQQKLWSNRRKSGGSRENKGGVNSSAMAGSRYPERKRKPERADIDQPAESPSGHPKTV